MCPARTRLEEEDDGATTKRSLDISCRREGGGAGARARDVSERRGNARSTGPSGRDAGPCGQGRRKGRAARGHGLAGLRRGGEGKLGPRLPAGPSAGSRQGETSLWAKREGKEVGPRGEKRGEGAESWLGLSGQKQREGELFLYFHFSFI